MYICKKKKKEIEKKRINCLFVFTCPCNGNTPNLRVTEAQQKRPLWLCPQPVLCLILAHKTNDGSEV